jgi:hypothetical protein
MKTDTINGALIDERNRQERLRNDGKFPFTCATVPGLTNPEKLAVLAEEFGEVARHVTEQVCGNKINLLELRDELVQVAAVCVAWLESMEEEDYA